VPVSEPRLTEADHQAWATWMRAARTHRGTRSYQRHLDCAKRVAADEAVIAKSPVLMWSGGKDSTAMTHLVRVGLGIDMPSVSEKDDLDYPEERGYIERLASDWGLRLTVVEPDISPSEHLASRSGELLAWDDLHSRKASLSIACFYGLMEQATETYDSTLLGLRQAESHGRRMNRVTRGLAYTRKSGKRVCTPLGDWSGLDVMAYMEGHSIEPLPVYKCIGFLAEHRAEPWRIRKSWWVPGKSGAKGGVAWLAHYYPSLYRKLRGWMPTAEGLR
jgi:3'-phosphoadenosine 5'-phosphosulfate sulfotransferase (PAPS reductase)/FAD synthetase